MPQSNRMSSTMKNGGRQQSSEQGSYSPQRMASQAQDYVTHAIDDQPLSAVLVCFAAGLAVGAGLVALSCQSEKDTLYQWGAGTRSQRQDLASRVSDAVMQVIPSQWRSALS